MDEIKEMQEKVGRNQRLSTVQCILFRSLRIIKPWHRDANRGGCAVSRWKYGSSDMPFTGEKEYIGAGEEGPKRNSR